MNPTITKNKSITSPGDCQDVKLGRVLKEIKNKDEYGIQELREETDPGKQEQMKKDLPAIIFGGRFSHRSKNNLIEASGYASLDFDCDTKAESERIKVMLENDKYIFSHFRSTRGLGWKALVRIPKVESDEEYKKYWYALEERYPETDSACKDISRACYYSYDPNLSVNKNAPVFEKTKELDINRASKNVQKLSREASKTNYGLINKAANIIRSAGKGERHTMILKAAHLVGGWVSNGKVDYQEAERILLNEANKVNPEDPHENQRTVEDGINEGIQKPLNDKEQQQLLDEQRIKNKFDKIFWTVDDKQDELDNLFENGRDEGYQTGYSDIDELYNLHLGYTTYIYGPPFSGKSQLWFDFLKNFSFRYGMKHVIFSPETGDAKDIFSKLISMVAGADFTDEYNNQMSRKQYDEAREFVNTHFIILDPGMQDITIEDIITACQLVERVYDIKLHTITVDPFNDINRNLQNYGGRQDLYLEDALKEIRIAARVNDWHICIITHPAKQQYIEKDGERYYPPASFRDVAGGQVWSRRGFMMSSIWRPPQGLDEYGGVELEGNEVFFYQQKYKPEWAGEKGKAVLKYDVKRHRYYQGTGALKSYANLDNEDEDTKEAPQQYVSTAPF